MRSEDGQARSRVLSGTAVALLHALLGYAFLTGLGIDWTQPMQARLKVFQLPDAPPPPEAVPDRKMAEERAERVKPAPRDPEGAAAPPNIRSRPTEVVAPKPVIQLPPPPPVAAAPIMGPGAAATSGNAPVRGPGTGAGGEGNGAGSGASGNGGGGGGGAGSGTPPVRLRGEIRPSDYPCREDRPCPPGVVGIRFVVLTSGRVGRCRVTRSSGYPEMDAATCAVLEKRLRYRPARDRWGRKIEWTIDGEQEWIPVEAPDRWIDADVPE